MAAEFDYSYGAHEAGEQCVVLVVRPNEKYGQAVPGDRVIVALKEAPNALRACESIDAAEARAEAEAKAKEAAAQPPPKSPTARAIEARFAAIRGESPAIEGEAPAVHPSDSAAEDPDAVPPSLRDETVEAPKPKKKPR